MEPLLKEKGREDPISRSSSPSSVASSTQWTPVLSKRRSRLTTFTILLLVASSAACAYYFIAPQYMVKEPHTFSIALNAREVPYAVPKDPQKAFNWRQEPFLPAELSTFDKAQQTFKSMIGRPATASPAAVAQIQHNIEINPKIIDLSNMVDHVRPEDIVFGFTSPYRRAREMCGAWRHFLQHGSQCLIVLPKEEIVYKRDMEFYLKKEGLNCKVDTVDLGQYPRYEHRVMDLPRRLRAQDWRDSAGNKIVPKWYVVADDDTQILDMRLLLREMSSRPHTEDHMMCAVTESKQQLGRHGRICYGGGGIVMSDSLAGKMSDHLGECLWWHHWRFGGDEMLTHCASTAASTEQHHIAPEELFEELVGLHQVDIPGDGSGVFQSGLPFISLHHWTGWLEIFPLSIVPDRFEALKRIQKSVDFLGGDNLFKRYMFDDGHTLVTLGYSITLYSQPLKKYEMQLMERTYRYQEHELRWPARPPVPEGKTKGRYKTTYYLLDVIPDQNLMIYQNSNNDTIRMTVNLP